MALPSLPNARFPPNVHCRAARPPPPPPPPHDRLCSCKRSACWPPAAHSAAHPSQPPPCLVTVRACLQAVCLLARMKGGTAPVAPKPAGGVLKAPAVPALPASQWSARKPPSLRAHLRLVSLMQACLDTPLRLPSGPGGCFAGRWVKEGSLSHNPTGAVATCRGRRASPEVGNDRAQALRRLGASHPEAMLQHAD